MRRIAETVLQIKCSHADAAIKFGVKVPLVHRLLKQYKADPTCFDDPAPKQRLKETKVRVVMDEVQKFRADGRHIWRANQLTQLVNG